MNKFVDSDFLNISLCPICASKSIFLKYSQIKLVTFLDINISFSILTCKNCFNSFLSPSPKKNTIPRLYTKNYFDDYEKNEVKIVKPTGNKKYLEIGPGNGCHLQTIVDSKMYDEIWIIDVTKNGFRFKNKLASPKINFRLGGIDEFKLPNGYFDTIYMSHVIEHTVKPDKVITALYKALKLGGKLEIFTPNFNCFANRLLGRGANYSCPHHLYFFSKPGMEYILKNIGITKYLIKTNWGNMLANTLTKNIWVKLLLSPMSIVGEFLFNAKDNLEIKIEKV